MKRNGARIARRIAIATKRNGGPRMAPATPLMFAAFDDPHDWRECSRGAECIFAPATATDNPHMDHAFR